MPIASTHDYETASHAFDDDWLTNYETENPDGNWVGMDFGGETDVSMVRIVPRGDDNDIHIGDEYELKYWSGRYWITHEIVVARDNVLHSDNLPSNCLLWLHDRDRGWDERPFLIDDDGNVEWW